MSSEDPVAAAWDELVNVDDRTSPEEYPDMCLITRDELAGFMARTAAAPTPSEVEPAEGLAEKFADPTAIAGEPFQTDPEYEADENGKPLWKCEVQSDGGHAIVAEVYGATKEAAAARGQTIADALSRTSAKTTELLRQAAEQLRRTADALFIYDGHASAPDLESGWSDPDGLTAYREATECAGHIDEMRTNGKLGAPHRLNAPAAQHRPSASEALKALDRADLVIGRDAPDGMATTSLTPHGWEQILAAIDAARGALSHPSDKATELLPAVPDDDLVDILGRPNFTCITIANLLRKGGAKIAKKAEAEQAHTLLFLLRFWREDRENWRQLAEAELRGLATVDAGSEAK